LWDITGKIEPVDDPKVASAILEKVNELNNDTGRDTLVLTIAWSILSQQVASTIAILGMMFTALYLVQDKLPTLVEPSSDGDL